MRVACGAALAVAVALLGRRLRRRGARGFGKRAARRWPSRSCTSTAGRRVRLLRARASGRGARRRSARLRPRSRGSRCARSEPALFNVGFGGALLAPFVASTGSGNVPVLLAYGAIVLAAGLRALRDRPWPKSLLVARHLRVGVHPRRRRGDGRDTLPWPRVAAPAAFAIAVAWLAIVCCCAIARARVWHTFASRGRDRRELRHPGVLPTAAARDAARGGDHGDGVRRFDAGGSRACARRCSGGAAPISALVVVFVLSPDASGAARDVDLVSRGRRPRSSPRSSIATASAAAMRSPRRSSAAWA
jgi:hypothetical protein